MTTNNKISARIAVLVKSGMPVEQAIDAVLGAGTYAKIASETYDALKARQ